MKGLPKRAVALFLCFLTVFSVMSVCAVPAEAAEDGITLRINALRSKFPHKKFWNHYVSKPSEAGLSQNPDESFANTVTSHPCASHNANAKVGQYECNYFDGGIQCMGFALKVFYDIFGVRASKMTKRTDIQNIRVGDYIRIPTDTGGHSAVVIKRSGDTLTVVEANYHPDGSAAGVAATLCYIYWDRTMSLSRVSYFMRASNYDTVKNDMSYTLDVNVSLDGTSYNSGHNNVTYDVYVNNSLVANDVKDYSAKVKYGSTYSVSDIKISGCLARANNNAISGKVSGNTSVNIPITVKHTPKDVPMTPAQCLEAGLTAGEICSLCGATLKAQTEIPATGHTYEDTVIDASCNSLQQVKHDCENCTYTYTETDPSLFTEWSESAAPADAVEVQTLTQYRYAEKEESWQATETGTIDYAVSWDSGFNKNNSLYTKYNKTPLTNKETETEKVVVTTSDIGYIYWHWCRGDYTSGPINRKIGNSKTSTYDTFHAFVSSADAAVVTDSNARKLSNGSVCKDTYWWVINRIQLKRCTYTKYIKVNTDGWGQWSEWQNEEITATDTIKVEERTLYRYVAPSEGLYDGHKWSQWEASGDYMVRTCSVCKETETEKKPDKGLLAGDCDFNGTVAAADARIALRASVGLETVTSDLKTVADMDKNGDITASDARTILRLSVGLEQ